MAAGYKKPLFTSRALRPGGAGTVAPEKPGKETLSIGALKGPKDIALPDTATKIGKGVPVPKLARGGTPTLPKIPKMPKMAKLPRFK